MVLREGCIQCCALGDVGAALDWPLPDHLQQQLGDLGVRRTLAPKLSNDLGQLGMGEPSNLFERDAQPPPTA